MRPFAIRGAAAGGSRAERLVRKRAATAQEPLGRRLGVHDRRHLELKLEYQPDPLVKRAEYRVEVFFFVPAALNVSPVTDPPEELYEGLHNYIRLKTPQMSWSELVALPSSPLRRAAEEAARVAEGADPATFVHETKLFACVFRAGVRHIERRTAAAMRAREPDLDRLSRWIEEELSAARRALGDLRALHELVERPGFPERARFSFQLADEYASLSIEQLLRRTIVHLDRAPDRATALKGRLLSEILAEEAYRRARGYPSILDPRSNNEDYVYRLGLLKKYCSSVLFLDIRRQRARRHWQELFFAIAAGIAMAFATVVAFWAQARYPTLGFRLFLIFVVAYMLKDRIKDAMRALFAGFLQRRMYDWKIEIEDSAGGTLGSLREKIDYLEEREVPADVADLRARASEPSARVAEAELRETVYRYRKEIVLDARRLDRRRGGGGVTDIMRFNVARLLREMDEPEEEIEWVDEKTFRIAPVKAAKVYHVDVGFRFTSRPGAPPQTTLLRLILDRRGIKRIERLEDATSPSASALTGVS